MELSKNKPVCQDISKRKDKFLSAIHETLNSVTTNEEMECLERLMAPANPSLAAIREKTKSFPKTDTPAANKNIFPQRRLFSTKKKKSGKFTDKKMIHTPTEINQNAVQLLNKNLE